MLNHKGGTMPRITYLVALVCVGCLVQAAAPALAAFPGDNGRILFDSPGKGGDADIFTVAPGGGKATNLTAASDGQDSLASWSPNGRRILFMSDRETPDNPDPKGSRGPDFEIFVMGADGSDPTQLTDNEFDDEDPAWSPDGKRIVFARDFNPVRGKVRYDVLTMNADGSGERQITDDPGDDFQPSWSRRNKIAFVSDRDGDLEIFSMSPAGKKVRQLSRNRLNDEFPNWSPDGRSIAFHRERDGNFDVYRMRARGGKVRRLTRHADGEGVPAWSPDGRRIAYSRFGESGVRVYTIRADGRDPKRVTGGGLEPFAPDWQPAR